MRTPVRAAAAVLRRLKHAVAGPNVRASRHDIETLTATVAELSREIRSTSRAQSSVTAAIEVRLDKVADVLNYDRVAQREVTDSIELRLEHLARTSQPDMTDWLAAQFRKRFRHLSNGDMAKARLGPMLSPMVPHAVAGFDKIRMGNTHDGGYICLDDFADIDAALSFGINDDVTWDLEVAEKNIPVYQYDYSVEGPPVPHERFHFFKRMVGPASADGLSIGEIVGQIGIAKPASAILKMDIEHAEWEVLDQTDPADLGKFAQITGEFHGFDEILDDDWFARVTRVFQKLGQQFALIHVHGNNCTAQVIMGDVLFPRSLELTLVNRARYDVRPSGETFPGPLDRPNDPYHPDFSLGRFIYST